MRFTIVSAFILICSLLIGPAAGFAQHYGGSEFLLGPGDVIKVFVYKELDLSVDEVPVRPDGKVSLPLIGELTASGKTAVELQKEVSQKLTQYIADPVVNVIVKEINSAQVSVLGEVKTPGMYKIKDRATLLDAIALAGGFTEYAKRGKVTVIRTIATGEQKRFQLNVNEQIKGKNGDLFYVLPYDKIFIQ
ncbi:MAG TPA: polysaccharide biosynthesis/export family protein [Terriglobia bacterium]|nr:polysaccharide biosynthesis/export family protein [Terriglobia bacterium]